MRPPHSIKPRPQRFISFSRNSAPYGYSSLAQQHPVKGLYDTSLPSHRHSRRQSVRFRRAGIIFGEASWCFFYTVTQQALLMVSLSHPRPLSCPHLSHDPLHAIPLPLPSPSSSFRTPQRPSRSRDVLRRIDREAGGRYKLPAEGREGGREREGGGWRSRRLRNCRRNVSTMTQSTDAAQWQQFRG